MKKLNRSTNRAPELPVRVLQYGEGNFLRAFVEDAFQQLNEHAAFNAGIAVVQPIEQGMVSVLREQDGLYTLFLQGLKNGKPVREIRCVDVVSRAVDPYRDYDTYIGLAELESLEFVISNTTEAGIAYTDSDRLEMKPPDSFPAKLTQFLYRRFKHFGGSADSGLTILPCELIRNNAGTLKDIIQKYVEKWSLGTEFKTWLADACDFHNTLVDRIVPGYPKDNLEEYTQELEYEDKLIVSAEHFFLWVIEGDRKLKEKLPFQKTPLDVKIVDDLQPFRTRKVRILNGCHTAMVPFSIMYGNSTVRETIDDNFTGEYVRQLVFGEIIPVLDMDRTELEGFAGEVFDRFRNPFIEHKLASIALNSVSKFRVRVLPGLLEYIEMNNKLPLRLTFSLACLIRFYRGEWEGAKLPVDDEPEIVDFMENAWNAGTLQETVKSVLENERLWALDLSGVNGMTEAINLALENLEVSGVKAGFENYSREMEILNRKLHA